jgi:5-methylcytosine-specific restriction endonuclease McrA|tara:strand:- start:1923 stop:2255 length:333 start_codon:yes stop_codon:yes gene_type:complete
MKKPKSICSKCRKIKGVSCICPEKESFQGFDRTNQSFYNSTKWRKYSHDIRRKEPLCRMCKEEGKTVLATMVDHIQSINNGGSKWDRANLQPLCHKHHSSKSTKDRKNSK